MSNHTTALVPLATSEFQSPQLFKLGEKADTGLFAESLIYYDTVYVHAGNTHQFANFISKLIQQGLSYNQLIELVENGSLKFVDIITAHPYCSRGMIKGESGNNIIFSFNPIEESAIKTPTYFEKKFLDTRFLRDSFSGFSEFNEKDYNRFCEIAKGNSLVLDGEILAPGLIDNVYEDFFDPERYKLVVKSILKEVYKINGLDKVPDFNVKIKKLDHQDLLRAAETLHLTHSTFVGREFNNSNKYEIYEVDSSKIPLKGVKDAEQYERMFRTLPLSCIGLANIYIRSAGRLKSDFFLSNPISQVIGNKLYEINDFEISRENVKKQNLVGKLQHMVRFPDLQALVNQNQIEFDRVLAIRKKAKRMREWMQQTDIDIENEWNVIDAYHHEIAEESGFTKNVRKGLHLFGFITTATAGGAIAHKLSNNPFSGAIGTGAGIIAGEVIKQAVEKATQKLFDYGADIGKDWKPVCFGNWYRKEIAEIITRKNKR